MDYDIWQVREKDGSRVWLYAVKVNKNHSITDYIDTSTQSLYNKVGRWEIKGYGDFPKFFRWDYTEGEANKHYSS